MVSEEYNETEEFDEEKTFEEEEEFAEKRHPVIKVDGHFCQLTNDPNFDCNALPKGLYSYDICKSEKTEGPFFKVETAVPDLYRWGKLFCREPLPIAEDGSYFPQKISALFLMEPPTAEEFQKMTESELTATRDCGYLYLSNNMGPIPVYPLLDIYKDFDNIYLGLDFYDEEEQCFDHYGAVTVNIDPLPYLCSAIDTNNNGDRMVDFLEREGFGKRTGQMLNSGFCRFPVFQFDEKVLCAIDPEIYRDYMKMHGRDPISAFPGRLDDKLYDAEERAAGHLNQPIERAPER